jgi:DNA repair protein RecO (recombination protein O)
MRQQTSPAIVLRRTNYAEADRIVTFLTPIGKIKAIVKGVRRSKSKLAGGIELFSESTITFLETRGDLQRVVSSRLDTHWDAIVGDLQRMMFGYEAMKLMDKLIENEASRDYYDLLKNTLAALADLDIPQASVEVWFYLRLLKLQGHEPNLKTDQSGTKLPEKSLYMFSPDEMCFIPSSQGVYRPDHVKLLRLASQHRVDVMKQIKDSGSLAATLQPLLKSLQQLQAN